MVIDIDREGWTLSRKKNDRVLWFDLKIEADFVFFTMFWLSSVIMATNNCNTAERPKAKINGCDWIDWLVVDVYSRWCCSTWQTLINSSSASVCFYSPTNRNLPNWCVHRPILLMDGRSCCLFRATIPVVLEGPIPWCLHACPVGSTTRDCHAYMLLLLVVWLRVRLFSDVIARVCLCVIGRLSRPLTWAAPPILVGFRVHSHLLLWDMVRDKLCIIYGAMLSGVSRLVISSFKFFFHWIRFSYTQLFQIWVETNVT